MPKRKANWWPSSILSDPDVLSVDDEGRFVLCKICHVHYAVHGGKKPKPVIMNSNFRTRAWDVHKERTNSHRLQKQQEHLQQTKLSTLQEQAIQSEDSVEKPELMQHRQAQEQVQTMPQSQTQTQTQPQASASQTQTLSPTSVTAASVPEMIPQPLVQSHSRTQPIARSQSGTQSPSWSHSGAQSPVRLHSGTQVLQQRRQQEDQQQQQQQLQLDLEETKNDEHDQSKVAARNSTVEKPASATSHVGSTATTSGAASTHDDRIMKGSNKRFASTMSLGAPVSRRRAFRTELSRQSVARSTEDSHEKHSFMVPSIANHTQKTSIPSKHAMAMEQQAESSARWRHMHDDVSRALSPTPRRRHQGPYTSGELRAAKTLAQTETGDLGGNNSERVAKKLRSLNAEYHASNMRYADAYNMRHTDVLDRHSASYKEYWGTLRNVYTSSGPRNGNTGATYVKSHCRSNPPAKSIQESKETEAESTTPDESGSSEEAFKPTVVVHDSSLIAAIERLTDVTSKQISNLYERGATGSRVSSKDALAGVSSVMADLRALHGHAFERMIELQEKHLKVMEGILDLKLRKEAARNASISSDNNGTTSGSSSGTNFTSNGVTSSQRV